MEVLPRIADAFVINTSLAVLYIVLPILLCILRNHAVGITPAPISIATIAAAAMAIQTLLGPVWQALISPSFSNYEPIAWGLGVCALIPLCCRSSKHHMRLTLPGDTRSSFILLTIIVFMAISLRLMHPVQQYYLGQSDAYTHLSFIRQIIERGALTNVSYPPGYHWIMALPGNLFPLDPYLIARYGGAFFGALLVLAVWELGGGLQNRRSALIAAFLVGCFPGTLLLIKTGVGTYPNQFGLFLLPVILMGYLKPEKTFRDLSLLNLLFLGLLISVPIMSLNLILLLGADIILRALAGRLRRPEMIFAIIVLTLTSTCTILILYSHQDFFLSSVAIVSNAAKPDSLMGGIQFLVSDFFKIKRFGFGTILFDTAVICMACIILICIISALIKQQRSFVLISVWALLTLLQTVTGILQFSSYQRAGWELLIAISLLGGYLYRLMFENRYQVKLLEYAVLLLLYVSALVSFRFYPSHNPTLSDSEDSLISLIWFLDQQSIPEYHSETFSFEKPDSTPWQNIIDQKPQILITRQFSNFTYGDPVKALLSKNADIKHIPIGSKSKLPIPDAQKTTAVVIDSCFDATTSQGAPTSQHLQPQQYERFLTSRDSICSINTTLRQWLDMLEKDRWNPAQTKYRNTEVIFVKKSI